MDIVGPLPAAAAQKKFLLVATNYFSKWIEVRTYASIKDKNVMKFVCKNIICRFEIPDSFPVGVPRFWSSDGSNQQNL